MKAQPVTLNASDVGELLRVWLDDGPAWRLSDDLLHRIEPGPYRLPVRAVLAQRNKDASDALWNDDFLRARALLLRDGLPDHCVGALVRVKMQARMARKQLLCNAIMRDNAKIHAMKANGSHWGTVKAVRSK